MKKKDINFKKLLLYYMSVTGNTYRTAVGMKDAAEKGGVRAFALATRAGAGKPVQL